MIYLILILFLSVALIAIFEDYLGKYKNIIFYTIGLFLILIAGLREVGIDPDSINYENTFLNYDNPIGTERIEFSFLFFSKFFSHICNDVHIIFLLYAFLGVSLKFIAFKQNEKTIFLPVLVYISFYYIFHECTQIRAGVMAGFFLLAIKPIANGEKIKALSLIIIGSIFHLSGLSLFPLIFLNNKPSTTYQRWKWGGLVISGYVIYFAGLSISLLLSANIPYIGPKLAIYQESIDKGIFTTAAHPLGPIQIFIILLYIFIMYFYDTLKEINCLFPLQIKIFSIGLFIYPAFAFFPVIGVRISQLLCIVNIALFANIAYSFKQKWAGIIIVTLISFIMLNYSMPYVLQFKLLY